MKIDRKLGWLSFFIGSLAITAVNAEPAIQIDTRYYAVSGQDAQSIYQNLKSRGPTGEDGQPYHAHTQWKLGWHYRWIESRSRCRLTRVEVSVDIDYLLPQLQPSEQQDKKLLEDWQNYYDALYRHEQQHKDHGVMAARELEQQLLKFDQPYDCQQLQTLLEKTAQGVMDKYDRLDKAFDRQTNHGINDGVVFPSPKP